MLKSSIFSLLHHKIKVLKFLHCTGEGKGHKLIKTVNNNHLPKKPISILTSVGAVLYHINYQDMSFDLKYVSNTLDYHFYGCPKFLG